jgi:hypothetical protein
MEADPTASGPAWKEPDYPSACNRCMSRASVRASMMATTSAILVATVLSGAAIAKGPSQAVIEGPGLAHPIPLRDPSSRTIGPYLASMVQESGFWDRLWCRHCRSRLARPAGVLGPRYTVHYTMTLEGHPSSQIIQYVYPYADPRPVTYMPGGQPYWRSGQKTTGGWYVTRPRLRQLLIEIGLPATAPQVTPNPAALATTRAGGGSSVFPILIALGFALAGASVILMVRRRMHRAAVT